MHCMPYRAIVRLATLCLLALAACATTAKETPIRRLIAAPFPGQDPSVIFHEGMYYLVQSDGNITIRAAASLEDLGKATPRVVWVAPPGAPYSQEVWAPELHLLDGRFVIYFAADDGKNANHRMYLLQGGQRPLDPYAFVGKVSDPSDRWAIDGTVLEVGDKRFFVWSGWERDVNVDQRLYIAPMRSATELGERVEISAPTETWERIGGPPFINEGPAILQRDGKVFVVYSASGSWTNDYCLGLLSADATSNLLSPASWRKTAGCVFAKVDGAYGPGHNSFVRSPSGDDIIVYHANAIAGSGWGGRSVRAQTFGWKPDGTPNFGVPLP